MRALNTSFLRALSQVRLRSWVQTHQCCWEASSWRKLEGRFLFQLLFGWGCTTGSPHCCTAAGLCPLSQHPGLHSGPDLLAQLQTCPSSPWTCWEITAQTLSLTTVSRPNPSPDSPCSTLAPCCDGHPPCYNVGLPASLHWWGSQIFLPHSNTSIKTNSFVKE